jgi:antitoxin VapB
MFFPIATFETCEIEEANRLLVSWGHKMGPCNRPEQYGLWCHVLRHEGEPVALTVTAPLVREHVGGGNDWMTRENTIELARLCASRKGLCRVALRMWREFHFPSHRLPWAMSYQDADLHTGATYKNDGWRRVGELCRGGSVDQRTGRVARKKWVWVYPPPSDEQLAALEAA